MSEALASKAVDIISRKKIMVIATAGQDGQPWNSPVAFFRFPGKLDFYWTSWQENQHSKNIRANSKIFIVVFDEEVARGVYFLAEAHELNDEQEVAVAAKVFGENNKFCPNEGSEYLGGMPRRIYKAVPKQAWMNADKVDEAGRFQYDFRKEISIDDLKTAVK